MLAVGQHKEGERRGLFLAGLVADVDDDFAHAFDWRLQNGLHLPDAVLVESPVRLEKGVDGFLGRRGGGKVGRIGLGKTGAAVGAGAEGSVADGPGAAGACCGAGIGRWWHMLLGSGLEYRNEEGNQRGGAEQTDRRTDQAVLLKRGKAPSY